MKLTKKVLYNTAKPCDFRWPYQNQQLSEQMLVFMRSENGIGLAAPQIGIAKRVFVMAIDGTTWTCFNPEILDTDSNLTDYTEGCLSFPGEECKIKRPSAVAVKYQNSHGHWTHEQLDGLVARCFQHELDHLDGITMQDRAKE